MKIILSDLTMTKVYTYQLITEKTSIEGYVNSTGTSVVSLAGSLTFEYNNINAYKYIKIASGATASLAPYARFIDANGTLVGSAITYTKGGETELTVPSGAVKFQITDTYSNKSNQISVYGKKG